MEPQDSPSLSSGHLLRRRFSIQSKIGEGGFGKTYLALDQDNKNALCVVKQLSQEKGEVGIKSFTKEEQALRSLIHPQIPRLLAAFEEDEYHYIVQEFVNGEDLRSEVLKVENHHIYCKDFLRDTLPVLEFVHSKGLIHRDIKPSNLMRQEDGKIVLIDFGAVKRIDVNLYNEQTEIPGIVKPNESTYVILTQGYSSPELASNPQFNSDIYALGVTLVRILTGCMPNVSDYKRTIRNICLNKNYTDILLKMTKENYHERYQSVVEILEELRRIEKISEAPTVAPAESKITPDRKYFFSKFAASVVFTCFVCLGGVEIYSPFIRPLVLVNQANRDLEKDDPDRALQKFDFAINQLQGERNFEAQKGRGHALLALERYEAALSSYTRSLQLRYDQKILVSQARALFQLGKEEDSLQVIERVLQETKGKEGYLLERAEAFNLKGLLSRQKNPKEALQYFDESRSITPDNPNVWFAKGFVLNELGKSGEGLTIFREALYLYDAKLKRNPNDLLIWLDRAFILGQMGRTQEAIDSCSEALKRNPNSYRALLAKANYLVSLNRFNEALDTLFQASKAREDSSKAWFTIGEIYYQKLRDLSKASSAYDSALTDNPTFLDALLQKGAILYEQDKLTEALAINDRAKKLDSSNVFVLLNRGVVLTKMRRCSEAKTSFDEALKLKPHFTEEIKSYRKSCGF